MSTVELSFSPLPAHVRTARLIASAVARRVGVDAQVLDEVRLAVGEACTRAVELHRRSGVTDLIRVSFTDGPNRFVISVEDCARAADPDVPAPGSDALAELARTADGDGDGDDALFEPLPAGVGIAVIGELVDDLDVEVTDSGTSVCMSWPLARDAEQAHAGDLGASSPSQ